MSECSLQDSLAVIKDTLLARRCVGSGPVVVRFHVVTAGSLRVGPYA